MTNKTRDNRFDHVPFNFAQFGDELIERWGLRETDFIVTSGFITSADVTSSEVALHWPDGSSIHFHDVPMLEAWTSGPFSVTKIHASYIDTGGGGVNIHRSYAWNGTWDRVLESDERRTDQLRWFMSDFSVCMRERHSFAEPKRYLPMMSTTWAKVRGMGEVHV
jgi:hypothetical protein